MVQVNIDIDSSSLVITATVLRLLELDDDSCEFEGFDERSSRVLSSDAERRYDGDGGRSGMCRSYLPLCGVSRSPLSLGNIQTQMRLSIHSNLLSNIFTFVRNSLCSS